MHLFFRVVDDVIVLHKDFSGDDYLAAKECAPSLGDKPFARLRVVLFSVGDQSVIPKLLEVVISGLCEVEVLLQVEAIFVLPVDGFDRFREATDQSGVQEFPALLRFN
jgi:hypothetical protein